MALPHEVAKDELVHVRVLRVIWASLFGLLIAGNASADQPTECDRLAGSPTDPRRVGAGIGLYGIEPAHAIAACEAALTADPNNPRLLFNLGRAHEVRGRVEQPSDEMALAGRSYKAAADKGYPAAQVMVAGFYWYGNAGLRQDPVEAMRVLDQAATSDPAEARQQRRMLFGDTTMAPSPLDAQMQLIRKYAAAGDPDALYALGFPARFAEDTLPDAVRVWRKAVTRGSASAAIELAGEYFRGKGGLSKDPAEAVRLIRQAAAGEDPSARTTAAIMYKNGRDGLAKDEKEAARLLKQASDEGERSAPYYLGKFYEEGKGGLPRDEREAARLYRLAADQGYEDAVLALAHYMAEGRGGYVRDKAKAVEYLKRAARWSREAKEELAKMGG